MKTTTIHTQTQTFQSDSLTPVSLYLSLRDKHRSPCLLESNDYHSRANSQSFIGLDPLITIRLTASHVEIEQNQQLEKISFQSPREGLDLLEQSLQHIQFFQGFENNGIVCFEMELLQSRKGVCRF